jgi:hypothetical protein
VGVTYQKTTPAIREALDQLRVACQRDGWQFDFQAAVRRTGAMTWWGAHELTGEWTITICPVVEPVSGGDDA